MLDMLLMTPNRYAIISFQLCYLLFIFYILFYYPACFFIYSILFYCAAVSELTSCADVFCC